MEECEGCDSSAQPPAPAQCSATGSHGTAKHHSSREIGTGMRMDGWQTAFPLLTLQWVFSTYSTVTQPGRRQCLWMQGTHGCWAGL